VTVEQGGINYLLKTPNPSTLHQHQLSPQWHRETVRLGNAAGARMSRSHDERLVEQSASRALPRGTGQRRVHVKRDEEGRIVGAGER
jgi:hypothetical protein